MGHAILYNSGSLSISTLLASQLADTGHKQQYMDQATLQMLGYNATRDVRASYYRKTKASHTG